MSTTKPIVIDVSNSSGTGIVELVDLVALKVFFDITEKWELKREEQMTLLGISSKSTYYKWKKIIVQTNDNPESDEAKPFKLPRHVLEHMALVVNIYESLQYLFREDQHATRWLRTIREGGFFGNQSALELMLSGNIADLIEVSKYLLAERGG